MYAAIKHTQMVTDAKVKQCPLSVSIYSLQTVEFHIVSMQSVSDLSLSWARGYEEKGFQRMEEIKLCHCTKSAPPPITANAHTYTSHTI